LKPWENLGRFFKYIGKVYDVFGEGSEAGSYSVSTVDVLEELGSCWGST